MDQDDQLKLLAERFERFEKNVTNKLDTLTDAMIKLARTEEKMVAMENDRTNMTNRVNRMSEKIDNLTEQVNDNNRTTQIVNKIVWGVIAGFIGLVFAVFKTSF